MALIRQCKTEDFEEIFSLLQQLWPDKSLNAGSLRKVYNKALKSESQIYICAVIKESIIGFATLSIKNNLWQEGNIGHIDELVVDGLHRGQGTGRQLLARLEELSWKNDCFRIELDTAFHRKEAHNFYENMGYKNRAYKFSKEL